LGNMEVDSHQYCCAIQVLQNKNMKLENHIVHLRLNNVIFFYCVIYLKGY